MEVGQSFCLLSPGDTHRLDAMAFWHTPGTPSVGFGTMLRHGLAFAPFRLGLAATRRLIETSDAVEAQRHRAHPGEEVWLLNNMIVHQDCRGKGLGTQLLGEQLSDIVVPSGRNAALATQRPENVTFSSRLGFEVVSEERVGFGEFSFRNWIMLFRP